MVPVPGHHITTPYKKRGKLWSLGWHTGSDFAASVGTKIVSATPGRVIAANAYDRSYGYKVIIRWGKYDVWYCHMRNGYATVRVGQTVEAGQQIGKVGDVGNITGPHLHMELRTAGAGFAASSFHDPQIAIDYQEDELPEPKDIWLWDGIPIQEPANTAENIAKNPNWSPKSVLSTMLREQAKQTILLEKLVARLEGDTPVEGGDTPKA